MSRFLSHLGTSAIMDLLLQLVAVPEGEQTRLGLAVVRWVEMAGVEVAAVEGAGVHGVIVRGVHEVMVRLSGEWNGMQ